MKMVSHTFLRALGVGLVGLLGVLLLVFFVTLFFASHENDRRMSVTDEMMPSVSISATPGFMAMGRGEGRGNDMMKGASIMRMDVASPQILERKTIKTGFLNLQVTSVDETVSGISRAAGEFGGLVSDSHMGQTVGGVKSGTMTVLVDGGKFNEALSRFKTFAAVVVSENVSGTDVTEQVIDVQARIDTRRAAEATLQRLFDQATKISDVIEITDKLALVRGEIESLEGQRRYLDTQTSFASITVSLTEDARVVTERGFRPLQTVRESLSLLVDLFGDITQGLIRGLIVGVPVLIINGTILWALFRIVRFWMMRFWPGVFPEKRRILRRK